MNTEIKDQDVDLDKVAQALSLNSNKILGYDVCPNSFCGFKGKFRKERRGNVLLLILLFCYGILPGIFYWIVHHGYDYYCPKCARKIDKK